MNKLRYNGVGATVVLAGLMALTLSSPATVEGQRGGGGPQDPGPRGGPASAGGTFAVIDNTNAAQDTADKAFFASAQEVFREVDSVKGTIPGEEGLGLGPRFNGNSCAQCHAFPATGGSSPAVNPQVANNFAHLDGASNPADLSGIIRLNGPVREARFVLDPTGNPDGGVHDLFSIAGRSDAPGCTLGQPTFAQQLAAHNVIFRIPTPTFGLGLVEDTPDETLEANLAATASQCSQMGISGTFNTNGNDGTITRFGWKAQNKSLLIFSGEAYNVEQGVTNENFENERIPFGTSAQVVAQCTFNGTPEDGTNISSSTSGNASTFSSDLVNFAGFMRLLAPPSPTTSTTSQVNGRNLFSQIGCNLCHSPSLTTGKSRFPALTNVTYHPYSDFAIHHMGSGLADGISQGGAGGDQFRSAPLWGLGQRLFFLHDGRTSNLLTAIQAHQSNGSEANQVVTQFNNLGGSQKQNILNFLRSL